MSIDQSAHVGWCIQSLGSIRDPRALTSDFRCSSNGDFTVASTIYIYINIDIYKYRCWHHLTISVSISSFDNDYTMIMNNNNNKKNLIQYHSIQSFSPVRRQRGARSSCDETKGPGNTWRKQAPKGYQQTCHDGRDGKRLVKPRWLKAISWICLIFEYIWMVVGVYPIKLDLKFMLHHRADKMLGTSFLLEFGLNSGLETRVCDQVWLCKIARFLRSLPLPKTSNQSQSKVKIWNSRKHLKTL